MRSIGSRANGALVIACVFVMIILFSKFSTHGRPAFPQSECPPSSVTSASSHLSSTATQPAAIGLLLRAVGYKPPFANERSPFFALSSQDVGRSLVIDVGAFDCTDYTIPAAKAGYKVYAFELSQSNARRCEENLKSSGINYARVTLKCGSKGIDPSPESVRVVLIVAGASDKPGCVSVASDAEMAFIGSTPGEAPVVALDDVVPLQESTYVLKIDTQGHEPAVLRGALSVLRRTRPSIIALEYWPRGSRLQNLVPEDTLKILTEEGYACFDAGTHSYNSLRRPSGLRGFTGFLEDQGMTVDPNGSWEDVVCARHVE